MKTTLELIRAGYYWGRMAKPDPNAWMVMIYFMALIFVTDCVIWWQSGSLSNYDWKYLIVYSLMIYPLWTLIAVKGVAKEQVDLMERSRWHAVDLLPGGPTLIFLGHYIGKMVKFSMLYVWIVVLVVLALYHHAPILAILLMLINIAFGAMNLLLIGILCRYYSPRGYREAINAIVRSLSALLSGSAFPIGILTQNTVLSIFLNPFSTVVSSPVFVILGDPTIKQAAITENQLMMTCSGIAWFVVLLLAAIRAERTQRENIYF